MLDHRSAEPAALSHRPESGTLSSEDRSRLTDDLVRRAHQAADDSRRSVLLDRVCLLNRSLAEDVAECYRGHGVPVEALYQAAFDGLLRSVRAFDPTGDHDLLTFAEAAIHAEVQRWLCDQNWLVRPRQGRGDS
jgi:DNA-directed RNA polymerase specialized sigma subunit